jgi:hypothetical protein
MKKKLLILISFIIAANTFANPPAKKLKDEKYGSLTIHFKNVVDGIPLKLNDSAFTYKNANGDDFKLTTFKYYVSNISLIDKNGNSILVPNTYLLINGSDSSTLTQKIANIPIGKYKGISFMIGVDSARNFGGAQTGSLDPANGMFWTWNSGYIFVKLEGVSSKSTSKKNRLTFHIGGSKAPDNTLRTFSEKFTKNLKIKEESTPIIELVANAAALFKGKTTVDFSKLNFTMGGPNSVVVADNYANGLFKVGEIKN